ATLAGEIDFVRIRRVAADDEQCDGGAGLTVQQPVAFVDRNVFGRALVDRADEVAAAQAGLGGGRAVAHGDDAQVILPAQLDTNFGGPLRRVRLVGGSDILWK